MIQLFRRTSLTQTFRKAGIPTTESDYYNACAKEEVNKAGMPAPRQSGYQFVFIPFQDDEELPEELTYEEALERAYRP